MVTISTINNNYLANANYTSAYILPASIINSTFRQDSHENNPNQSFLSKIAHTIFSLEGLFMGWWFSHLIPDTFEFIHSKYSFVPKTSKLYPVLGVMTGLIAGSLVHEIINDTKETLQEKLDNNVSPGFFHSLGQFAVNTLSALFVSTLLISKKAFSIIYSQHTENFAKEYTTGLNKIEDLYIQIIKKLGVKDLPRIQRTNKTSYDLLMELEEMHKNSKKINNYITSAQGLTSLNKFTAKSLNTGYKFITNLINFETWNKERKLNLPVYKEFGKKILILSTVGIGIEYLLHIIHNLSSNLFNNNSKT